MGVAMLARAAHSGENIRDLAQRWVRIVDVCEPDPKNAEFYRDRFHTYKKLYPALRRLD